MRHLLLPLGDSAAYLEFSQELDLNVNAVVQALALKVRALELPWIKDIVPALGGLALHFDLDSPQAPAKPLQAVSVMLEPLLNSPHEASLLEPREIQVPVCYEADCAPDLTEVAAQLKLTSQEVVRRHCAAQYSVLMMGFVPGHPYLGGLDPSLRVPRRLSPRPQVPAGSIAIANLQSVIYPFATPGGWNLIGRTPLKLFDAARQQPCLFAPRDRVRFVPINNDEFLRLQRSIALESS